MSESNKDQQANNNNADNPHINIKVKGQDGTEIYFKIKRTTQLKKLMDAYCSRQGIQANMCRFIFDGERIKDDDTPESLEMENGDEIDAMVEQTGGGRSGVTGGCVNSFESLRIRLKDNLGENFELAAELWESVNAHEEEGKLSIGYGNCAGRDFC